MPGALGPLRLLLAHAGGFSWDEALLVLAPIALVAALLFLANQRAKKLGGVDEPAPPAQPDPAAPTDPAAPPDPAGPAASTPEPTPGSKDLRPGS